MHKEIDEYQKYLTGFIGVKKPKMPKFNTSAYTDNEYLCAVGALMEDYDRIYDEYLTIRYLKGE